MNFTKTVETWKKSNGKNQKIFILGHHTGSNEKTTWEAMTAYLSINRNAYVSAHYTIGRNGEISWFVI